MPTQADLLALKKAMSTRYLAKATLETVTTFAAAEKQMYLLMAELLPMLRNPAAGVPSALVDRAIAFVRLWRQLSHKPLATHYRALNPAWFEALGM